jgi:hypothetical protein
MRERRASAARDGGLRRAIFGYRVCAVSFNSDVAADVALAALGTTQLNAVSFGRHANVVHAAQ